MTEHIVKSYEGQLQELTNTIIKMGALAESQFSNSMIALLKRDQDLADKVSGKDFLMNEFDIKIENLVINLIALRQPMGIDLRETVSSMRIYSELERIPIVRSIYSGVTQFTKSFQDDGSANKKVVLIEFPRPGAWAVGFATNETGKPISSKTSRSVSSRAPRSACSA